MALYKAYLDESYTDSGVPIWAVGGYLFRSDQARLADAEWKRVLDDFGVPHFHMVDVAPCKEIFEPLGMDRCDQLAHAMIDIIKRYALFGAVAFTNPKLDNYAVKAGVPDDAYARCLEMCVLGLGDMASLQDATARVAFFFETGHGTGNIASRMLTARTDGYFYTKASKWYVSHAFAKKTEVRLLQAADLLVWQGAKYLKDKVSKARKPRKDFKSLMELPHRFYYTYSVKGNLVVGSEVNPTRGSNPGLDEQIAQMFIRTK